MLALLTLVVASASLGGADAPYPSRGAVRRVIYRAAKVAGFESLGVTMIACRHRDPVPRRFAVQFFDRAGRQVSTFGNVAARRRRPPARRSCS